MSSTLGLDHDRVADLFANEPTAIADPWPIWRQIRDAGPVTRSNSMFFVTRHGDVREVLRDAARFSNDTRREGSHAMQFRASLTPARREAFDELAAFHALFMVTRDSDAHARLRTITSRAFTPRRIRELEAATRLYVAQAVDDLAEGRSEDLMDLALGVPLRIVADLLGVEENDFERIKSWSRDWIEHQFTPDDRIFISLEAQRDFRTYVEEVLERHRHGPNATDLVSALMGAEHDDRLSPEEFAATYFMLLFAGHETTSNLIGTGIYEMLVRPEQWRLLADDPTLAPQAVEELLRFCCPVQFEYRRAVEPTEIGDVEIPVGATVTALMAEANRDQEVFDRPDELDIKRPGPLPHLGFGFGPHFCLGASLARLETQIAYTELARRLPELELAADTVPWRGGALMRGVAELPVRIGRPRS